MDKETLTDPPQMQKPEISKKNRKKITMNASSEEDEGNKEWIHLFEKMFNKKLDTFYMMIESCVNKKMAQMRRKSVKKTDDKDKDDEPRCVQFGQENYKYITLLYISELIRSISSFEAILQKVIKELYFNPLHRENNDVYIPPHSYKTIAVYCDNTWKIFELTNTLELMIKRANDVLQHYIIEENENEDNNAFLKEIGKRKYNELKRFTNKIDNLEEFPEFKEKLLKDTEFTILTNQHIVHPHVFDQENEFSD